MSPWRRDDTKKWISIVEHRIADMNYYMQLALNWCSEREVYDQALIVKCMMTACIWVSHMRQESISFGEIYDLMGAKEDSEDLNPQNPNDTIEFVPGAGECDLEDLLFELLRS
jgi:hypothetical protein